MPACFLASLRMVPHYTMRFESTTKALAKYELKYYRISECTGL